MAGLMETSARLPRRPGESDASFAARQFYARKLSSSPVPPPGTDYDAKQFWDSWKDLKRMDDGLRVNQPPPPAPPPAFVEPPTGPGVIELKNEWRAQGNPLKEYIDPHHVLKDI